VHDNDINGVRTASEPSRSRAGLFTSVRYAAFSMQRTRSDEASAISESSSLFVRRQPQREVQQDDSLLDLLLGRGIGA
jgi:hypothetical protein